MARQTGVTYLPGTDNVIDLQEYRHRKRMREIIGKGADFYTLDDLSDGCAEYLNHHDRMLKATDALRKKATWRKE